MSNEQQRDPGYPGGQRDATIWVEEFFRIYPQGKADADTMLGWFANAIETGVMIGARDATTDEPGLREVCPTCDGLTFHKYGCTFGLAPIPDPEPITNETASGYARRRELTALARWTDEHGSPEGADRAIREAMDIP